ncbi:gliding motility-associated C-terminal domain-containing protein [uncultured Prevotella sp.]|uniref:gliding motility-associated C-terminal domain-containing protein n=1 Tax=uncultured Prevotella sp. TaxID=159272 RepID=UPI0026017930|nr:gliding motility-associated C-terminal domain-containing protein [uncultured Prevotella sp.]
MGNKLLFTCVVTLITTINVTVGAFDETPTISPTATYITNDGEEENTDMSGNAPLVGRFMANPQNVGEYSAIYEWRFTMEGESAPYLTRYEENTEYTFMKAGTHNIVVYATFINGNDTIAYTQEFWDETGPMRVTISESKLEMPNAFSPNGDGINDIYKAKDGYQSIIEFHAYIFNRWGQKLYEWDDPADGWDGKYNGKDVKQGVYYVLVKAKGADGRTFNIRRDVNLLRGYTEGTNSAATE